MQVLAVGARLSAAQLAHVASGVVVVIERADRLAELQMLGAEDYAARDGDAVVDDDAGILRNVGKSLHDGAGIPVVEYQAAFQADQQHVGVGGPGKESGTAG